MLQANQQALNPPSDKPISSNSATSSKPNSKKRAADEDGEIDMAKSGEVKRTMAEAPASNTETDKEPPLQRRKRAKTSMPEGLSGQDDFPATEPESEGEAMDEDA